MAERTPYDRLKYATQKAAEKCPDSGAWDKWARRFLMGIDNTIEAATKALRKNDARYAVKFPPEPETSSYDPSDSYDKGINLVNSYTFTSSSASISYNSADPDEEDEDEKPSIQSLKNQFVARSAICRAVIAWGEWTMERRDGPAKEDLMNEMEIELSQADGAMSDL